MIWICCRGGGGRRGGRGGRGRIRFEEVVEDGREGSRKEGAGIGLVGVGCYVRKGIYRGGWFVFGSWVEFMIDLLQMQTLQSFGWEFGCLLGLNQESGYLSTRENSPRIDNKCRIHRVKVLFPASQVDNP